MNYRGILWTAFISYGVPSFFLFVIYIRITIFIRQQSYDPARVIQRRQARDLVVIRRIFITVGALIFLGVPSVVLVVMAAVTGEENPLSFRITWISLSISMTGLSVAMVFFIPQLKSIVWKRRQRNRIATISGSVTNSIEMATYHRHRRNN
jgi:hypothetical protein